MSKRVIGVKKRVIGVKGRAQNRKLQNIPNFENSSLVSGNVISKCVQLLV